MRERCHRCHTILTSEDKHHYSISCETCDCDMQWEDYEQHLTIKSAYWRWRAICFGVRVLRHYPGRLRDLLVQRLLGGANERPEFQDVRRKR